MAVGKAKRESSFKNMPRFIIGVVDMQITRARAAARPLVQIKGLPNGFHGLVVV